MVLSAGESRKRNLGTIHRNWNDKLEQVNYVNRICIMRLISINRSLMAGKCHHLIYQVHCSIRCKSDAFPWNTRKTLIVVARVVSDVEEIWLM